MPKFDHFSQRIEFYRFLTENLNMYQNLILIQFNLGVFYAKVFNLIFVQLFELFLKSCTLN